MGTYFCNFDKNRKNSQKNGPAKYPDNQKFKTVLNSAGMKSAIFKSKFRIIAISTEITTFPGAQFFLGHPNCAEVL